MYDDALNRLRWAIARGNRVGVFVDVDGTISPIAATPDQARVDSACREALRHLAKRLALVAVVTGRRTDDALGMIGLSELVYVGNHGFEIMRDGRLAESSDLSVSPEELGDLLDRVRGRVSLPGLLFEHKGTTASIHFRNAPDHSTARRAVLDALAADAAASSVKITEGRMVVEVRPRERRDKGTAVADLARTFGLRAAVYLGDDVTDLDAFRALHRLEQDRILTDAVAVAVANEETPPDVLANADVVVEGVAGAGRFLQGLLRWTGVPGSV